MDLGHNGFIQRVGVVQNGGSSFVGQDHINPLTTSPCMTNFIGIHIYKIDPVVLTIEKLDELNPQFLTG